MTFSLASLKAAVRLLTAAACTFLLIISATSFQVLYAQEVPPPTGGPATTGGLARLTGKVTDKDSGEELIGVSVSVVGTRTGASTNVDGVFNIQVAPGTYDVRASYIGYKPQTVKTVVITAAGPNRADFNLEVEGVTAQEIVVEATQSNATEGALLTQQRKSTTVQDAISAELIRRTPDSDAGEAVKRVTGVSLVGGKFVFVRGLGERYSNTQLNGVTIPSPEPEKKVVPFDIIPANLIENIITIKTFQPDQPGTFGGGLVRIKTKEFPDEFLLNIGVASGFNSYAHFANRISYPGGATDWLGFDNGTRNKPAGFSAPPFSGGNYNQAAGVASLRQLNQNYEPRITTFGPNYSYNISLADQLRLGAIPLGYIASLTYGSDFAYKDQFIAFPQFAAASKPNIFQYDQQVSTYNVSWGGLINFSTRAGENNKFGLKTTYNRSAEDETLVGVGDDVGYSDYLQRNIRLRYIERELLSTQLSGNHYISLLGKSEIEWKLQYATAKRGEPDNRTTRFQKLVPFGLPPLSDSSYFFNADSRKNFRFYSDLLDVERDVLVDWKIPFRQWSGLNANIKFGGLYTSKNRRFNAERFIFDRDPSGSGDFESNPLSPNQIFSVAYVSAPNSNVQFATTTQLTDQYDAVEGIRAGYIMTELSLTSQLRFIGGVRIENNEVSVVSGNPALPTGGYNVTNALPAAHLIYSLGEAMNFRLSFSQTVAQPELRELAPFIFEDVTSLVGGNLFLTQSKIVNYDFRWEWYPRLGELIAISAFYKTITDPIERIVLYKSQPYYTAANLAERATNIGAEFEARKRLDFISPVIKDFGISLNLTLVSSLVTSKSVLLVYDQAESDGRSELAYVATRERPLQGQSPFVINANLSYTNEDLGFSGLLLYNIVGRRISSLANDPALFGDFYEESRNQVDLSLSKTILRKLSAKLSIRNILDDRFLTTVEGTGATSDRYKTGRSFSLSFSFAL